MSEKILEVKDLVVEFKTDRGSICAVNGVNFEVFNDFLLNKKFFITNADKFKKEIDTRIHPNTMTSRIFYNSIMLDKWLNNHK